MEKEEEPAKSDETAPDHAVVDENGDVIDEKKLLRKLDWHLLPCLTTLFFISFIDRSNSTYFSFLNLPPLIPL